MLIMKTDIPMQVLGSMWTYECYLDQVAQAQKKKKKSKSRIRDIWVEKNVDWNLRSDIFVPLKTIFQYEGRIFPAILEG